MALTTKYFTASISIPSSVSSAGNSRMFSSSLLVYTVSASRIAKVRIAAIICNRYAYPAGGYDVDYVFYNSAMLGNYSLTGSYSQLLTAYPSYITAYRSGLLETLPGRGEQGNQTLAIHASLYYSHSYYTPSMSVGLTPRYAPTEYYLGPGQTIGLALSLSTNSIGPGFGGVYADMTISCIVIEEAAG